MKRITRDNIVPPNMHHQIKEPVSFVELGESFVVETINIPSGITRTPEDANPKVFHDRGETGPIYVNGIEPGDVLAIHIEDIRPEGHACGGSLPGSNLQTFHQIDEDKVRFPGNLWAPKRMMIGDIYVTPKDLPYYVNPYDHGGNMDFKDISLGNTLFLKAELAGGLLVLGDCHAVQGDGEMLGLAAECAAEVKLRITKDEKYRPKRPFIMKPESFVCIACRNPYASAREVAIKDATEMLARIKGCTEAEAWLYVVTVGDLRNGAIWAMGKTEPEWMTKLPLVVGVEVPLLD